MIRPAGQSFHCRKILCLDVAKVQKREGECAFRMMQEECLPSLCRWLECVRAKRGLCDTRHPGGLAKDQAAFDGLVRILRFRCAVCEMLSYAARVCVRLCVRVCINAV